MSGTVVDELVVYGMETTAEDDWRGAELGVRTTVDDLMGRREIVDVGRGGGMETTLRDEDVVGIGMGTLDDRIGLREIVDVGRGRGMVTVLRDEDEVGHGLEAAPTLGRGTVINESAASVDEATRRDRKACHISSLTGKVSKRSWVSAFGSSSHLALCINCKD